MTEVSGVLMVTDGYVGRLVAREVLRREPAAQLVVAMRKRDVMPEPALDPALDGVEVRFCDFEDPAEMLDAFRGVERLLLMPTPSARRHPTGGNLLSAPLLPAVTAAAEAGVRHLIHPRPPVATGMELTPQATHAQIAATLEEAGVTGTMLETAITPDFLASEVRHAIEVGELAAPAGDAVVSPLLGVDLAAALAATLLASTPGDSATYELSGFDTISWNDLAALASACSGRSIAYRPLTEDDAAAQWRAEGVLDAQIPVRLGMYRAFRSGWSAEPTGDFDRLAGRAATSARAAVTAAFDRTMF